MGANLNETRGDCIRYSIRMYTIVNILKYSIKNEAIKLHKNKIANYFNNKEPIRNKIEYIKLGTRDKYIKCWLLLCYKNIGAVLILKYVDKIVAVSMNRLIEYVLNIDSVFNLEIGIEWRTL